MIEDFESAFNVIQNDNIPFTGTSSPLPDKPTTSSPRTVSPPFEEKKAHVKPGTLAAAFIKPIISAAVSEPVYTSIPSQSHYFMAEVRKRSPYDFTMVARDPFHYLYCELPLSFEEDQEGGKRSFSLICEFPTIGDDQLVDFIQGDEDLLGMTLISFHVHILNNLFLFCAARKAEKLIIKATEGHFHGLGIYEAFIEHVDKVPTKKGMAIEITIPFQAQSLAACDEFMDDIIQKFRKTLWQDQRSNPVIQDYLKANMRLSVVA